MGSAYVRVVGAVLVLSALSAAAALMIGVGIIGNNRTALLLGILSGSLTAAAGGYFGGPIFARYSRETLQRVGPSDLETTKRRLLAAGLLTTGLFAISLVALFFNHSLDAWAAGAAAVTVWIGSVVWIGVHRER